jgi:hypothetical protein
LAGQKSLRLTNDQVRAAQNVPFGRVSDCHAPSQDVPELRAPGMPHFGVAAKQAGGLLTRESCSHDLGLGVVY